MKYPRKSTLVPSGEQLVGILSLGLLLTVAFSTVERGNWVTHSPFLVFPIFLSLTLSNYLLHQHLSSKAVHTRAISAGAIGAIFLGLGLWVSSSVSNIVMGTFLLCTAWWISHLTFWLASSKSSRISTIIPGLLVLLISIAFLPSYNLFILPVYLLSTAPALAYFHLKRTRIIPTARTILVPLLVGSILISISIGFSWPIPHPSNALRPQLANRLEEPLYNLWEKTSTLFEHIPDKKEWPQLNMYPTLPFTGPVRLNDDILFVVKASDPHKWRLRVYETYTSEGWVRPSETTQSNLNPGTKLSQISEDLESRQNSEILIRIHSSNTHMVSAGVPVESSIPSKIEHSPNPKFIINLSDDQNTFLPPDIARLQLQTALRNLPFNDRHVILDNLAGEGLRRSDEVAHRAETSITVERSVAAFAPTTAMLFPMRQNPPESYVTRGSISVAPIAALRGASLNYPSWVTDRYLQLPTSYPDNLKTLALELVTGQNTTYDKVSNIQTFLLALPRHKALVAPPPNREPMDWFINVQHVGFSNYYASAMTTMLRSLGIPARLVAGFAPGEWDDQRQAWVVKAKHYHAWPEVYFPGYGWVEFEPTPMKVQPSLEELEAQSGSALAFEKPVVLDECFLLGVACGEDSIQSVIERFQFSGPGNKPALDSGIAPLPQEAPHDGNAPVVIWSIAALALIILIPILIRIYLGSIVKKIGRTSFIYRSMCVMAKLAGVPKQAQDTATEHGRRLISSLPENSDKILQVVESYELSQYSEAKYIEVNQARTLQTTWSVLRWSLLRLIVLRLIRYRLAYPLRRSLD